MAARSRIRRVAKWVGLSFSFVFATAWAVSQLWFVRHQSITGAELHLVQGRVKVFDLLGPADELRKFASLSGVSMGAGWWLSRVPDPLAELARTHRYPFFQTQPLGPTLPRSSWRIFVIPLWLPFFLIAAPTAFLWYRDRRRIPPGHCPKCGYNLSLNLSGTCPECGLEHKNAEHMNT